MPLGTVGGNLSAVHIQQPILHLAGVTFSGRQRLVPSPSSSGGAGGAVDHGSSPPAGSPDSAPPGQGGGWRQMQRQQHDYQFGPRGGTMNTNPSAPPSKRRRTMTEAFEDMSLSRRRGMAGLDLATTTTTSTDAAGDVGRFVGFGGGLQQQEQDEETFAFALGAGRGTAGPNNSTSCRPSRPSPIAGLNGSEPRQHIDFSSVAVPLGIMRRSVGSRGGATPTEETIEEDTEDSFSMSRTGSGRSFGGSVGTSPYGIAAPTALPPKPNSNVVRISSSDMGSASETASEMDEGVLDGFPHPLIGAAGTASSDKPKNPVDAKIEELIRRDRLKAMIQAKLEAEGKKSDNGSDSISGPSQRKPRDDFDYQGTFTTAGSATWRKPDAVMDIPPAAVAASSITPISIPAAMPPQNPASGPAMVLSAAAAVTMPPPARVATNPTANPNSSDAKVSPGMQRGRSAERRSSCGARSRSLPRQYMKLAPQPTKSRDVSMASASSAATGGADDASDMDL